MSKKKNEYTVDDILAEYNRNDGDAGSERDGDDVKSNSEEAAEEIFEDFADDDDIVIVEEKLEEVSVSEENGDESDNSSEDLLWEDVISGSADEIEKTYIAEKEKTEEASENPKAEETGDTSGESQKENKDMSEEKNTENEISAESSGFIGRFLPVKGDSVAEIIRKIIFIVAVVVFIGAGIMLVSTLVQSKNALSDKEEVKGIITTTVATTMDEEGNVVTIAPTEEEVAQHNFNVAEHFKSINEDYIGYLELPGCDIFEPVMQSDESDRSYYLTHTYYGGVNKAGAIYADVRCTVSEEYTSPNLVLYGHNQEDGTMFGNLKLYKNDIEFYRENPVVKFSPEFETGEYLIYGYFVTHIYPSQDSNGVVFHYQDYIETMNDENTFNWYQEMVQERNQIISPVDVKFGDKLLCLSTCSNEFSNSRFVVFARKLRDGEKVSDYDFSEARLNPYAKGVDWSAIMSGETTTSVSEETSESSDETTVPEDAEYSSDSESSSETTKKKKKNKTTTATEETAVVAETSVSEENTVSGSGDETSVPENAESGDESSISETSDTSQTEEDYFYDYDYYYSDTSLW